MFRFIPDTNTQFQAMRGGEVDMIAPQPQLQIADIKKQAGIRVQSGPEFAWEHLDFQLGAKGHPALRQPFVRQAIVTGINRQQIATALYKEIAPGLPVLNNAIYKPFQSEYQAHKWQPFGFSQKKAISLLRAKGCTGGPATPSSRNNDIYSCPGVGQAVVQVLLDGRQPAPLTGVPDHAAPAEEHRHRPREQLPHRCLLGAPDP